MPGGLLALSRLISNRRSGPLGRQYVSGFLFLARACYPKLTGTVLGIGSFPVVSCRDDKRDERLFGRMTTNLQFFFSSLFSFLAPSFLQSAGFSSDGQALGSCFKCSPRVDADNSNAAQPLSLPSPCTVPIFAAVQGT